MELIPPRSFKENLLYRAEVRKWAMRSEKNREWLMEKCRDDFFFWVETFCYLYEPRPEKGKPKVIPFIPWEHQREPFQIIIDCLGYQDVGLEKARGEGASWGCLMIILWRWLFHEMESYALVSMNEQMADNQEDPGSLGWKLDWQLQQLPRWMTGEKSNKQNQGRGYSRNLSKHSWINERNGSTITAHACTGDLASGSRKTAFLMDELAKFTRGADEDAMSATEPVTNCRLLVSTPKGASGAYFKSMRENSSMVKVVLDWTKNPTRNRMLFRIDLKQNKLYDATYPENTVELNEGYQKVFFEEHLEQLQRRGYDVTDEEKLWSPWYVERCLRTRMTPKKIAQEYDRDYGGSSSRFFPESTIRLLRENTRLPNVCGEVICDYDKMKVESFTKLNNGLLRLWLDLHLDIHPPRSEYVLGIDVATGQGGSMSSNSVISIFDRRKQMKVGEYANPNIPPEQLARLAVCLARWFRNEDGESAYMIWEGNGPGGSFRNFIVQETNFRNFYFRTPQKLVSGKATKEPGWWSNKDTKRELLSRYRHSLMEMLYENPSDISLTETLCYVEDTGGKVTFESELNEEDDPANDGENHGDRVIADALANHAHEYLGGASTQEEVADVAKPPPVAAPAGSFLDRRHKHILANKKPSW